MTQPAAPPRILRGTIENTITAGLEGGFGLEPGAVPAHILPPESPIVQDIHSVFDVSGFERRRMPIVVGEGDLAAVPVGTAFNSLPIKFPGTEYRVPTELQPVKNLLEKCVSLEVNLNPSVENYYAYVSLQRSWVYTGEQQRSSTKHSDGIQGPRIQPKVPIEHGYAVVDRFPTHFFVQSFGMTGIDVDRHHMDAAFERQADRRQIATFPLGAIVLFDTYCVHQAVPATDEGPRTFFRLTYSTRQYDRLGNSINMLFSNEYEDTEWEFQPRPLPALEMPPERS